MEKLVIFIPSLRYGGAERVITILAEEFLKKYEVYIITESFYNGIEYELNKNIKRIKLKSSNKIFSIIEIRKIIKKINPKICLIFFAPQYSYIYWALFGTKVKQIVSERNDPKNFSGSKLNKIIYQKLLKKADGIVFQTKEAMQYYYEKKEDNCIIIQNPVDIKKLPEIYTGTRKKKIVNIGRLHEQKNQELLIRAISIIEDKISDYYLEIYGVGELEKKLKSIVKELKLEDRIFFKGNSNNILEEIIDSSLFVLSSNYEGMPNALIEAMCLGIPVISTNCTCGGPRELIVNGENGILVPVKDRNTLAETIYEVLKNEELKNKLSKNGYKLREKLESGKIANQWMEFFKSFE